ncbi:uncharacterized protein LOC133641200 [Entelurus aequoreus]|uniref:uncharacterized protein LOC133641200 n=1 Tax=Entelurus aequoreus TaxID=161455 RepID=UPI002B1D6B76|nr:uncharacterized protein LOC133641200 [Entelurus aequoreus]
MEFSNKVTRPPLADQIKQAVAIIKALPDIFPSPIAPPKKLGHASEAMLHILESCVGVQQLCDLLELYLRWKEVETVFWMWMESVVGCQVTEAVAERPTPTHTPSRRAGVCHTGRQQLEGIQSRLTTVQKVLKTARGDTEDRGERLAGSGDMPHHPPPSLGLSQTYRARLQAGPPVEQGGQVWVCQVWEERERCLLERRNTLRRTNRLQFLGELRHWCLPGKTQSPAEVDIFIPTSGFVKVCIFSPVVVVVDRDVCEGESEERGIWAKVQADYHQYITRSQDKKQHIHSICSPPPITPLSSPQ